jgi:ABC-2 type transport system ATP-binding protein
LDQVVSPLIHVLGLGKRFGALTVLDSVSLELRAGESLALLGANGAGKTTLLRIVATLLRPSRGRVSVAGFDGVNEAEQVRRVVAYVGHGSHLYEDLTAQENLTFWATLAGQSAGDEVIQGALAAVDLDRAAGERVRAFWAGMKRRLSLARLLLARPRVLSSTGVRQPGPAGKEWLAEHLLAFKAAGSAIVVSTHGFGRGPDVADRVAILAEGVVLDAARADPTGCSDSALHRRPVKLAAGRNRTVEGRARGRRTKRR